MGIMLKYSYKIIGSVLTVLAISGCAEMNTSIKNFNESMYSAQNTLTGVYEQDISNVIAPFPDRTTKTNFMQAQNTIQKGLSIMACADEGNSELMMSRMARYSADGYCFKTHFPYFINIKHHTDGCLLIEKINSFSSRNIDEISFNASFVSQQTGESSVKRYNMIKKGNDWLFNFH